MKKFREHRNLAPILHFRSDWAQEFVLTITIHQKTYLTNTTANICCYSNDKIWKFQNIFECVFFR